MLSWRSSSFTGKVVATFETVQSSLNCRLRNSLSHPVARRMHLHLTHQHHIAMRLLHPNLCSPTWTGRPRGEQHHSDEKRRRRTRQMMRILSSTCNRFARTQIQHGCISTLSRLGEGKHISIFLYEFDRCFTHSSIDALFLGSI